MKVPNYGRIDMFTINAALLALEGNKLRLGDGELIKSMAQNNHIAYLECVFHIPDSPDYGFCSTMETWHEGRLFL